MDEALPRASAVENGRLPPPFETRPCPQSCGHRVPAGPCLTVPGHPRASLLNSLALPRGRTGHTRHTHRKATSKNTDDACAVRTRHPEQPREKGGGAPKSSASGHRATQRLHSTACAEDTTQGHTDVCARTRKAARCTAAPRQRRPTRPRGMRDKRSVFCAPSVSRSRGRRRGTRHNVHVVSRSTQRAGGATDGEIGGVWGMEGDGGGHGASFRGDGHVLGESVGEGPTPP